MSRPVSAVDQTRYDELLRLADAYDQAGEQMRAWSDLGPQILADPEVTDSAALSPRSWTTAEDAVREATLGKHGLLTRSLELDADALVLRATVLTYRWIDELQLAAYQTLGAIAGRAIGYLAPEIELGGAVVAAGLIETEALDRDGMAAYLGELALSHPDLMEHVTTGGGLAESLQVRALLTSSAPADDPAVRRGGLRAIGVPALELDLTTAVRDAAAAVSGETDTAPAAEVGEAGTPTGLAGLFRELHAVPRPRGVRRLAPDRAIVLLRGDADDVPEAAEETGPARLVAGQPHVAALEERIRAALSNGTDSTGGTPGNGTDGEVRLLLVGSGTGGAAALALARSGRLAVDQVVTAGSPATHLHGLPAEVPVVSFDRRSDPVALLGSLINAGDTARLTVLHDDEDLVAAGAEADASPHPALRDLSTRLREHGYLS